jgi:hypothetical protein
MATYSVEVREATRGGDDYTENHYDFETPEEVTKYINNEMYKNEHVHSVLKYADGETNNPKDVTHQFVRSKKR